MTAKKKYHIAVLTNHFPSISETFVVNHITGLIEAGFEVTILTRRKQNISKSSQPEIIKTYGLLEKTIEYLPQNSESPFKKLTSLFAIGFERPAMWRKILGLVSLSKNDRTLEIKRLLQQRVFKKLAGYDFYHAHFGLNGLHLAEMHREKIIDAPFGVTFHGIGAHPQQGASVFTEQHQYLFDNASFVLANSKYLDGILESLGCPKNKLFVVPIEIDTSFFTFKKRTSKDSFKLISVGRLISLKGHEYAIRAIQLLIAKGLQVEYTIVGEGENRTFLEHLIAESKLDNHVKLVGQKNQNEILMYLHDSDIFIMPSVTDVDGRAEAFGLATLEAQATGLPIVAFNSGGISDTIHDNKTGILVKEKDVASMANALETLLCEHELREVYGTDARAWVEENFGVEKIRNKLVSLTINAIKNQ